MEESKFEPVNGNGHSYYGHEGRDINRDAVALTPESTQVSFAHLDQKKILRKMDVRLIPC
jgi:hypothetical protein